MNSNGRKNKLGIVLIVVVAIIALVIAVLLMRQDKNKELKTSDTEAQNASSDSGQSKDTPSDGQSNIDQKDNGQSTTPSATSVNESDPYSLYNASIVKYNSKDYTAALSYIDKAIGLKSDEAMFYSLEAEILVRLGRKADAISAIETGLTALPGNELLESKLEVIKNVP